MEPRQNTLSAWRMCLKPVPQSRIQPGLPTVAGCAKFFNDIPRQPYRHLLRASRFASHRSGAAELLHQARREDFFDSAEPPQVDRRQLAHLSCVIGQGFGFFHIS
jgi:hypothetical protein